MLSDVEFGEVFRRDTAMRIANFGTDNWPREDIVGNFPAVGVPPFPFLLADLITNQLNLEAAGKRTNRGNYGGGSLQTGVAGKSITSIILETLTEVQ